MVSISTTHHLDGGWCLEDGLDAVDVNREARVGGGGGGAVDDVEDEEFNEEDVDEADDPTNDRTNE